MFSNVFGSRTKKARQARQVPARTARFGCEQLGDRIVPSAANLVVNEVLVNPPGSPDTGKEFAEFRVLNSDRGTGTTFTNLFAVAIEGEEGGTKPNDSGTLDTVVKLSDHTSGYAGQQYIVVADSTSTLATTTGTSGVFVIKVSGFNLENGSMSVGVVQTAAALSVGTDLDTNDDGVIDSTVTIGTTTSAVSYIDGVGFNEDPVDDPNDRVYGFNVTPAGASPADPDDMIRDKNFTTTYSSYIAAHSGVNTQSDYNTNAWYAAEASGSFPSYSLSLTFGSATGTNTAPSHSTPGAANN